MHFIVVSFCKLSWCLYNTHNKSLYLSLSIISLCYTHAWYCRILQNYIDITNWWKRNVYMLKQLLIHVDNSEMSGDSIKSMWIWFVCRKIEKCEYFCIIDYIIFILKNIFILRSIYSKFPLTCDSISEYINLTKYIVIIHG